VKNRNHALATIPFVANSPILNFLRRLTQAALADAADAEFKPKIPYLGNKVKISQKTSQAILMLKLRS